MKMPMALPPSPGILRRSGARRMTFPLALLPPGRARLVCRTNLGRRRDLRSIPFCNAAAATPPSGPAPKAASQDIAPLAGSMAAPAVTKLKTDERKAAGHAAMKDVKPVEGQPPLLALGLGIVDCNLIADWKHEVPIAAGPLPFLADDDKATAVFNSDLLGAAAATQKPPLAATGDPKQCVAEAPRNPCLAWAKSWTKEWFNLLLNQ